MFTASMRFDLGEDVAALRETVHRWAQDRIRPMAAEIDRTNAFPSELWPEMGDLGLLGITVEEDYGGAGMGYLAHAVAVEEIARASASVSLSYGAHSNLCVNQIRLNGTDEQKAKYLPGLVSGRHVGALADHVMRALKEAGHGKARVEGLPHCDWVLIDAGDVVVHLFRPEVRSFYNIEKIWSVDSPHITPAN